MGEAEKAQFLQEIDKVLEVLRQGIRQHAGDVELLDFEEDSGRVFVRLHGTCVGCPFSQITLKAGIEDTLCQIFPQIQEVVDVPVEQKEGV